MFERIKRWRLGKQYGYETFFKGQDRLPVGKPGVILADMGMPEDYEPEFYIRYMSHVFHYVLPPFLHRIVLADRGIVLIDPHNPLARESFEPLQLVDMHGSSSNREGRSYTECKVTWHPPRMKKNPWDSGYFLYTSEGKGGAPDICQKTAAKVVGWYYGRLLPERKVAWAHQCRRVYEDVVAKLGERCPQLELRHARYVYPESMRQAVEELLAAGCETVVYQCFSNPVYSDFSEYAYALPMVHQFVNGRARVICADQLGNQPMMRKAYVQIIRDQLARLPAQSRVLLILSRHGHPFKKETLDVRGLEYNRPLEAEARQVMEEWGGQWQLVWSDDEYADEYWDPKHKKLETLAAYRRAIGEAYDYALEVPTDFMAENTDLMIFHAMKKFTAFAEYDPYAPIPYPDWEQPLVRSFRQGRTTGIYTGCPVGPYRKHVVEATVASILETLHLA
jgi:protoheme ferro-lyase